MLTPSQLSHIHTFTPYTHPHTPTPHSQSVYLLIFICSEYQSCGPQAWLQSEERAVSMATERPDPTLCTRAANQTTKREERQSVQREKKTKDEYLFMKVEEIEMLSFFQFDTHIHTHTFANPFRVKSAESFT